MSMQENLKKLAAEKALEYIEDGMTIGIGSGSTVAQFIRLLARKVKDENLNIKGVPTSIDTQLMMNLFGIPAANIFEVENIDIAVDGADSVLIDKNLLIKGGGGAFTQEKIIDYWAEKLVIIVDETKVNRHYKIPLEIIPMALNSVKKALKKYFPEHKFELRLCKGKVGPCISDNGNIIADLHLPKLLIKKELENLLNSIPGIVENGIFTKKSTVLIAKSNFKVMKIELEGF